MLFTVIFCYQCLFKEINIYRVLPCAGTRRLAGKRQIPDSWILYSSGEYDKQANKQTHNFLYLLFGVSFMKTTVKPGKGIHRWWWCWWGRGGTPVHRTVRGSLSAVERFEEGKKKQYTETWTSKRVKHEDRETALQSEDTVPATQRPWGRGSLGMFKGQCD